MRRTSLSPLLTLLITLLAASSFFAFPLSSFAGEDAPARKGPSKLLGAPVNTAIAGGAILPQNMLLTVLNWSLRDRTSQVHGSKVDNGNTPDIFTQIWLLKIRYGLFDRLEINTVVPYVSNHREDLTPEYIEGLGDISAGASLAVLSERAGDPLWLTLSGALLLPTGQYGKSHLPGNGAFGGRAVLSLSKMLTPNIKTDMDFAVSGPFERGNQKVKRGNEYQWNAQVRYLFENVPFDIGLESVLTKTESSDKRLPTGDHIRAFYS